MHVGARVEGWPGQAATALTSIQENQIWEVDSVTDLCPHLCETVWRTGAEAGWTEAGSDPELM